jgi:hypothetical protein
VIFDDCFDIATSLELVACKYTKLMGKSAFKQSKMCQDYDNRCRIC